MGKMYKFRCLKWEMRSILPMDFVRMKGQKAKEVQCILETLFEHLSKPQEDFVKKISQDFTEDSTIRSSRLLPLDSAISFWQLTLK